MRLPRIPLSGHPPAPTPTPSPQIAASSGNKVSPIRNDTRGPKGYRLVKVPGVTCFRPSFSPDQRPAYATQKFLDDPYHVLHLKTKRRIEARDKNTLWTMVYTANAVSQYRTVRSFCNRKMKRGLEEALALRGFDYNGRQLQQPRSQDNRKKIPGRPSKQFPLQNLGNLKGSLTFQLLEPMITAKQEDVNAQAVKVVDAVVKLCQPYPILSGMQRLRKPREPRSGKPSSGKPRPRATLITEKSEAKAVHP
ncbi:hypothetical protein L228DRAFT_241242 [Xylona heveae TC161]|uniref:Uncharacterized protein n=1 Tax=Xylona heveae (strain CBS 132557 / TC161) TaxID=1328760 RepID=A0A165A758_XYLHT|nr:hypothetical protein L228DRAFT_241242 [Xylona heveae TC161]KZF20050.1 hypothetical protein L228DRAFT_241242 [Xylona heveae TC161]